uniref:ABC transporter domain-containing protein n=2 Tax=Rhodosorus marinus TaxID=101924 RepID=A0A7S2ZWD0_9RHOD
MAGLVSAVTAIVFPQYALPVGVACASLEAFKALRKKGAEQSKMEEIAGAEVSGKISPVTLRWKNLSYKARTRKKGSVHILKDCTGEAKPGHLLALMGPSGAGKTSLINVLASQVPRSAKAEIRGQLTCNAYQKTV